jgi:hypothetical protein
MTKHADPVMMDWSLPMGEDCVTNEKLVVHARWDT